MDLVIKYELKKPMKHNYALQNTWKKFQIYW